MHAEPKALLKEGILKILPDLRLLVGQYAVPHQVWTKIGEGQWKGEVVLRPNMEQVFSAGHKQIEEAGQTFAKSFLAHHQEYKGMVGSPRFGRFNLGLNITDIFRSVIKHLWQKYETFNLDEDTVDSLVNEFEMFVDKPTMRFLFRSQLLNFNSPSDSIDLPEGLRIRRMTEKEVSAFHGGAFDALGMIRPRGFGVHEFCIEGETDEPKMFGDLKEGEQPTEDRVKASLDKAILCLRTFKEGQVGYDYVHFYPLTFCPLPLLSFCYGDLYVPFGNYALSVEDVEALAAHGTLVFNVSEPSMKMACSRLADAETRTKPQDRLVDAVIGMEALLLAALGKGDGRGELRFRFSLHYSTLFGTPEERYRAFRLAKNLYDLRSMVAHGSTLSDGAFQVGDEKLKLPEAANRASETLRHLVRHFLPSAKQAQAPYGTPEFWERAYLGLPDVKPVEPGAAPDPAGL
jgi:hypothetical protein